MYDHKKLNKRTHQVLKALSSLEVLGIFANLPLLLWDSCALLEKLIQGVEVFAHVPSLIGLPGGLGLGALHGTESLLTKRGHGPRESLEGKVFISDRGTRPFNPALPEHTEASAIF